MLERLIAEIRTGGTIETSKLAERLGTSPQMVHAMLEHLQINGYIQAYSNCGDGCMGCSLKSSCGLGVGGERIHIWRSSGD